MTTHIFDITRTDGSRVFIPVSRLIRIEIIEQKILLGFDDPTNQDGVFRVTVTLKAGGEVVVDSVRSSLINQQLRPIYLHVGQGIEDIAFMHH